MYSQKDTKNTSCFKSAEKLEVITECQDSQSYLNAEGDARESLSKFRDWASGGGGEQHCHLPPAAPSCVTQGTVSAFNCFT